MSNLIAIIGVEFRKLLATRRGWIAIGSFAFVWLVQLFVVIAPLARFVDKPQVREPVADLLAFFGVESLLDWPVPQMALYWLIGLFLFPFYALVISADQTVSDRTRGTLRFLVLRTSRLRIFMGRFLAHFVIMAVLVLATQLTVLWQISQTAPQQLLEASARAPALVVNLLLVLLPYVAIMSFASIVARSARQANIYAVLGWLLASVLLLTAQNRYGPMPWLNWILPGSQIPALLKLQGWDTLRLAPIPIVHTALFLVIGWWIMRRRTL